MPQAAAYDGLTPAPLVVYLHGGGAGMVTEPDMVCSCSKFCSSWGWISAFPKCPNQPKTGAWNCAEGEACVFDLIAKLREQYAIDSRRIYLAGGSMGGWGTLYIAGRHPDRFAAVGAAAPECIGVDPQGLKKLPVFLVHGDKDVVCHADRTRALDADLARLGGVHKYVEIKGAGHALPDEAIQQLFDWIANYALSEKPVSGKR